MPACFVRIYSNGYYLDQNLIKEYVEAGMDAMNTTGYGESNYIRLIEYDVSVPYSVLYGHLDERLDYYDKIKGTGDTSLKSSCATFLDQICIYSNGELGMCCLDYLHPYALGNVCNNTLESILRNKRIIQLQEKLLQGDRREIILCQNCGRSR